MGEQTPAAPVIKLPEPLPCDSEGLHAIANCNKKDLQADVVFIHGLGGASHCTWRHGKAGQPGHFFWPEQLGIDLPTCAIWSVGYPAGFTGLGKPGMIIERRAGNIAHRLANHGMGNRPLFFITHSMGGLIVKSLIVDSQTLPDLDRKQIVGMIRGVVFCATPHRGSEFADMAGVMGRYLAGAAGALLFGPMGAILGNIIGKGRLGTQAHVNEMRANAEPLDLLHDKFIEWHRTHPISILSYAENIKLLHKTWFLRIVPLGLVVPHSSANPGLAGQTMRDVDEDHLSLVKPSKQQHVVYAGVLRFIQNELAKQLTGEQLVGRDGRRDGLTKQLDAAFARSLVEILPEQSPTSSTQPTLSESSNQSPQSFGRISSYGGVKVFNINIYNVHLSIGGTISSSFDAMLSSVGIRNENRTQILEANTEGIDKRSKAEKALQQLQAALAVWDYERAEESAKKVEGLLDQYGKDLGNDILSAGLLLVARTYICRAEVTRTEAARCVPLAEAQLARAQSIGGSSAEWVALTASIISLRECPDAALALLAGRTDCHAIRTRTALLLNQQKFSDAMAAIDGLEPHECWCDLAVTAYAFNDRIEEAQKLVRWAEELPDRTRYPQCCIRLAQGILSQVIDSHSKGENVLPQSLTASEREKLTVGVEALRPVLQPIQTAGKPLYGMDMAALRIAWQANYLLQIRDAASGALRLMAKWTPVSVDVARGVISGLIEATPDLPERLQHDHPDDFNANILAGVIASAFFGRHKETFAKAKGLVSLADTNTKKEELFRLLQTLWQSLEGPEVAECEAIAGPLVTHDLHINTIFKASVALRRGDVDKAVSLLNKQKAVDDPYWLQMRANACFQKGQLTDAVDYLLPAAKRTLDPGLLHKTADIAFQAKRYDAAVWCYEKLVEAQPANLLIHGNLASIYAFILHDLERAAFQFQALRAAEPNNPTHTLNLSICLAQLFRPDESLVLFDELCHLEAPPLPAVIGRAQLHHSLGNSEAAWTALEVFRPQFWGNPDFVLAYMSTSYSAGREEAAHEAMVALNSMQQAGAVKSETFRAVAKDEALEMFKQSFKQVQDRNEYLHTEMLKGRMPWVWAEQVSDTPIYWGWRTRMQDFGWIGDEPTYRARFCIYSTNGFHACESERGHRELLPLGCPPAGTRIVADISALITLHRLDLLDAAAEYFSEVLVPAGYLPTILEDSRRMVLNQRSRQEGAERIIKQINSGRIAVLAEDEKSSSDMPVVDEYAESLEHRYRLVDVIQPVYAEGGVNDADLANISRVSAKLSAVDDAHPALSRFQNVIVDLTTLETIVRAGLLDSIVGFFRVRITAAAHREVIQRLDAIVCQENTRQWHIGLWRRLRSDPRFKFVLHTVPKEMRDKDNDAKNYLPFLASFISQETKIPLMADDRACQAFTLNEAVDVPLAAFGSDVLILRLMADGKIDAEKAADAIRQLMAWRYRFLVPPPEILKVLADMHKGNPPGQALRDVAIYVHECMRDMGLFGGPEKTELGDSMAMRTYLTWSRNVAEFIMLIWADESFSPEASTRLTAWICKELLPSSPHVADGRMKVRIGDMTSRLVLSHALLKTATRFGEPRMADAMKAIKDGLSLTNDEYQRIVLGILNDTARTTPQP